MYVYECVAKLCIYLPVMLPLVVMLFCLLFPCGA